MLTNELLILRHAKSAWDTGAPTDFERPLAKRGQKAAPQVGRYLSEQGWVPDFVVCSPARRAKQTALAACAEMKIGPDSIHFDERIYGGWTMALVAVLRESPPTARRVMIVGHNPGLEGLLQHLSDQRVASAADGKLLPTAAVARLQIKTEWRDLDAGSGTLLSVTRSNSLKDY
jgi:phosphohistidine phosphatase